MTPLHLAVQSGNLELVRLLTSLSECDTNATDQYGFTALHFAVLLHNREIVQHLLECGASVLNTSKVFIPQFYSSSHSFFLFFSILHECIDLFTIILTISINMIIFPQNNSTPLDLAKELQYDDIADMLQSKYQAENGKSIVLIFLVVRSNLSSFF